VFLRARAIRDKQWLRCRRGIGSSRGFGKGELRLRAFAYKCVHVYEEESRTRGGCQHQLGVVSNLIDLEFNTYGQIATNTFCRSRGRMGGRSLPFRSNAPITVADNQKCLTKDVNQFGYDCGSVSREDCGKAEKVDSLCLSNEF